MLSNRIEINMFNKKGFDSFPLKWELRPQPMRVPEIQPQTGVRR